MRQPFQVLEILASGTYGTVCSALDGRRPVDDAVVALKILREELSGETRFKARLALEGRTLQRVAHPNVVAVREVVELGGRPVLVMELVRGIEADELLEGDPEGASGPVVLELVRQTALALHAAWNAPDDLGAPLRVVHGDVKPSNIMLSASGVVKLLDFGLSTVNADRADASGEEHELVGTIGFLAPELRKGRRGGHPADVYALGMTLHELLTGRLLELREVTGVHDFEKLRGLIGFSATGLDERTERRCVALIDKMCAFLPADRPSAAEVAAAIGSLGLRVDLARFARARVLPALETRKRAELETHPEFAEIAAFAAEPPDTADGRLRAFLAGPGWWTRSDELYALLREARGVEPLLEVLFRATGPWWERWIRPMSPAELVTALHALLPRVDDAVRAAAAPLREHPDARVARAAGLLWS